MAPPPLEPLGLSSEQVRTAADFHEAYARTVLAEAESAGGPSAENLIEAASAYRLAGQWRLLVDPREAVRGTLTQAADLFTEAGLTFGAYLRTSLAPGAVEQSAQEWTARLLANDVSAHPQQQTYLLLACASLARRGTDTEAVLTRFATESPHRVGVVPMGSLAMPVRMFWGLALGLLEADGDRSAESYAATLSELFRAYARSIDLAMANRLTWSNAAAPVDVADLDVIGAVAMGVRHFGAVRMRELLAGTVGKLPRVAEVLLSIGMTVARPPGPDIGPPRL